MEVELDTRRIMRWVVYFVLATLVAVFLYNQLNLRQPERDIISLQALATEIKDGNVEKISIDDNTLQVELAGGNEVVSHKEEAVSLIGALNNLGVDRRCCATSR